MIPPDVPYALKWSIPTIRQCGHLAFSPSALWLAGGSIDGFLILMQATEGNIKYELDLSNSITALISLPGPGDTFVCGHNDGSLTITTIEPDQVHLSVDRWPGSADRIEHLTASAASEIATCSSDEISLWIFNSTLARWVATGKHCNLRYPSKHDRSSEVQDLQFMAHSNTLLISHRQEGLICLNSTSMETTWIVRPAFEITRFYISYDDSHILATTADGIVRIIPFQDGTTVQIDEEQGLGIVADSPSGASFGHRDTEVLCLSVDLKKIIWTTRIGRGFRELDDGSSERIKTFTTFRSRPGVNAFVACSYGPATGPSRVVVWEHGSQNFHLKSRVKTRTVSTGISPPGNFKRVTWEIHDGGNKQELDHGDGNEAIKNVDEPVEPDSFKDSHGTVTHASPGLRPLFEADSLLGSLGQKLGMGVMVQPGVFDSIVTVIASSAVLLFLLSLFLKVNGPEMLRFKTACEAFTPWMSPFFEILRESASRRFELITHLTSSHLEKGRLYIAQCTRSLWSEIRMFLLHVLGGAIDDGRM